MSVVVALVLGSVLGGLAVPASREVFAADLFKERNHRGAVIPVGVGVLVALVAVAAEAVFGLADRAGHGPGASAGRITAVLVVVAFALLGLVDDLAAAGPDRGFAGHIRALLHGRLTTGGLKLLGGGLVSLAVALWLESGGLGAVVVDAALVALSANLANLLDRAPGRAGKYGVVAFALLAAATAMPPDLVGVAVVVGAVMGLLPGDLSERFMLGDAGANPLGAVLGLGVVLTASLPVRVGVLVVVFALNLLSERVSFSRVIERTPVLRSFDRLGRRP